MRNPKVKLMIQPSMVLLGKEDGSGYDIRTDSDNHKAILSIGDVSVAFDGRNNFDNVSGYYGSVIELSDYENDPVRRDNKSIQAGIGCAEKLLIALAEQLGYSITRDEDTDESVCMTYQGMTIGVDPTELKKLTGCRERCDHSGSNALTDIVKLITIPE
jgi:hypothetical protein